MPMKIIALYLIRSVKLICNHQTDVISFYPCAVVPEVCVHHDDIPGADHGLHVPVTRPPALGRGAEQPGLSAGHLD